MGATRCRKNTLSDPPVADRGSCPKALGKLQDYGTTADPSLLARYDRRRRTIARDEVQRLSARNYARHRESRADQRQAIWQDLQDTVADPRRHKDYLMDAAMIRSRQREQAIA
ncbi:MAG: hypothetical protein ACPGPG_07175 [Luminiphilus sp.]